MALIGFFMLLGKGNFANWFPVATSVMIVWVLVKLNEIHFSYSSTVNKFVNNPLSENDDNNFPLKSQTKASPSKRETKNLWRNGTKKFLLFLICWTPVNSRTSPLII